MTTTYIDCHYAREVSLQQQRGNSDHGAGDNREHRLFAPFNRPRNRYSGGLLDYMGCG